MAQATIAALGPPQIRRTKSTVVQSDQEHFQYTVTMNNDIDLETVNLTPCVESIEIDEIDDGMDVATVRMHNMNNTITDDPIFKENVTMRLATTYSNTTNAARNRRYTVPSPRAQFKKSGQMIIEMVGYGEEIVLSRQERRRTFESQKDSDIAQRIAIDAGLTPDVRDTSKTYEYIAQVNETDSQFLSRRAALYGYQFYVQDGVLRFGPPRFDDSGIIMQYRAGGESSLERIDLQIETYMRGGSVQATSLNPVDKTVINVEGSPGDPISRRIEQIEPGVRNIGQIVRDAGNQRHFILHKGHSPDASEFAALASGHRQAFDWAVTAEITSYGVPEVKPRRLVSLLGLGRFSGLYYVKWVRHMMKGGSKASGEKGYRMKAGLTRTSTGPFGSSSYSADFGVLPTKGDINDITTELPSQGRIVA